LANPLKDVIILTAQRTLGVEAIPQAWREKLENRQYIEELALKLVEM
jgi:hypothetical protein